MKIFNGKKGLERWMLIMIILAILGFGIILWYIYIAKPYSAFDKEACRASIVIRSIPVAGESLKAAAPLNCKTEQIKIDKSYKTEDQIKNRIATAMAECWNIVGKGEMNFMPQGIWKQRYCLICSNIQFDERIKKNFPIVDGLLHYMNDSKMQGEATYYNYIWGEGSKLPPGLDVSIDTSKDYAIMFSLEKEGWLMKNKAAIGAVIIAGSVIAVIATGGTAAPVVVGTIAATTTTTATATTTTVVAIFASEAAATTLGTTILTGVVTGASKLAIGAALGKIALSTFFLTNAGEAGLHLIPYEGKEIEKYCTRFENAP